MASLRGSLMFPRSDWNRRGPRLPRWFSDKLRQIDRTLVMQYMPPTHAYDIDGGVNKDVFPTGAWVVCRKLPRSRMLLKQWVYCITDPEKGHRPSMNALRIIKYCRNASRKNGMNDVARKLDRNIERLKREKSERSRNRLAHGIVASCREHGITKKAMGIPQVFMGG